MAEEVKLAVEQGVPGGRCRATVEESACGTGVEVTVVAAAFEGLTRFKRHQLVQPLVFAALPALHKLCIHTLSPTEAVARGVEL